MVRPPDRIPESETPESVVVLLLRDDRELEESELEEECDGTGLGDRRRLRPPMGLLEGVDMTDTGDGREAALGGLMM